ncbi:hypothetical protein BS47DRAFT_1396718 [Hydnum rufescens UP504]|uniref:Secreted protein n=1 Tax=Hydnum rufescens UP504 TaxID=1448309 RepID=A0A9P6AQG7_9AGAM|nr:hypothetical protein BS47DRAFT_1396718 [Hydnum rufescens UP504]
MLIVLYCFIVYVLRWISAPTNPHALNRNTPWTHQRVPNHKDICRLYLLLREHLPSRARIYDDDNHRPTNYKLGRCAKFVIKTSSVHDQKPPQQGQRGKQKQCQPSIAHAAPR